MVFISMIVQGVFCYVTLNMSLSFQGAVSAILSGSVKMPPPPRWRRRVHRPQLQRRAALHIAQTAPDQYIPDTLSYNHRLRM